MSQTRTRTKAGMDHVVVDPVYFMQRTEVSKGKENFGKIVRLKRETVFELNRLVGTIKPGPRGLGIAFAQIRESEPHFHKKMTEYYFVTQGIAMLKVNDEEFEIKPSTIAVIPPGVVHSVMSVLEAGVNLIVLSDPPWKKSDHFLAKDVSELKRR
jgi:mannose-6-phosphate isomerase-like protein (cupin superfamily)